MRRCTDIVRAWSSFACIAAAIGAAAGLTAPARAAPPVNDDCSTPTAISRAGTFAFDLTEATEDPANIILPCGPATLDIAGDVWFCWTANCTGLATITTCGQTQVDTILAFYNGCACPTQSTNPLCCNDDVGASNCPRQSEVRCEAVCGRRYMIRVGHKFGQAGGPGSIVITCTGQPGGEGCLTPPPDDSCCGTKPRYTDPAYATFTGQIDAMTAFVLDPAPVFDYSVTIHDLSGQCTAPQDANWNPANFRYNHPSWTKAVLGSLMGLTFTDRGDILVAHSAVYGGGQLGTVGGDTGGSVYKLANGTGTPSLFANVPGTAAPGLGGIDFDCTHGRDGQVFVASFDDGHVYRLDGATGAVLSAYDHGVQGRTAAGMPIIADDPTQPFTDLGRRVWAVRKRGDRLYYGVWSRDGSNYNDATSTLPANAVWSVGLDGAGNFLPATARVELYLPAYPQTASSPAHLYSNPPADIAFSADSPARMMVAERSVFSSGNNTVFTGAHESRAMEFEFTGGAWALSSSNTNPGTFPPSTPNFGVPVGELGDHTNSAGGCDYDRDPGIACDPRAWISADALILNGTTACYGAAGVLHDCPTACPTVANSIFFDYNGNTAQQDKTRLGGIRVPCVQACMTVSNQQVLCDHDAATNVWTYTFQVCNNTSVTAFYALFAPPPGSPFTFLPSIVPLNGGAGLLPGQCTSVTATLQYNLPGEFCPPGQTCEFCFTLTLTDRDVQACCSQEQCITIPNCSCGQVEREVVVCRGGGSYAYTFTFTNFTNDFIEHMFLFPATPTGTFVPDHIAFGPPIPPGGSVNLTVNLVGGTPGSTTCFRISIHNHMLMECCSFVHCVTLGPCDGISPCPTDINGDGTVNVNDYLAFLSLYAAGDHRVDFTNDGYVNIQDYLAFLALFARGC
jgi:hypothetical protein